MTQVATIDLVQQQTEMSQYIGKRIHGSQLEDFQSNGIWDRLKSVKSWNVRKHAYDRLAEKGINATYEDLISCIHDSTLIEYKIDYNPITNRCDERVVLRANAVVNYCYNIHVVYSLSQQRIITVWMNNVNDLHKTLDWSIYDESMKVFGV